MATERVLDIAEVLRSIVTCLDFNAVDKLLVVLQLDESGRTYLKDSELWKELLQLQFRGRIAEDHRFLALPTKPRAWRWTDEELTCPELREFLRSGDELAHFKRTVSVVRGDIGTIKQIDGVPLDGLAFPTNSHLTNHMIGAAAAVFKRAGKGLTDLVNAPTFRGRRNVGDAVPTPGFDAGVQRIIHCVGPRISQPQCFQLLSTVYENVMNVSLAEDLHCIAIASVSTGALGVPPKQAAKFGLRAIQKFIREHHWQGKVAIVCFEDYVLDAFEANYADLIDNFNFIPEFPEQGTERAAFPPPWMANIANALQLH